MSVKILTKKRLDSNSYNKMVINEINGNYFINVSSEEADYECESLSYKLSDGFRKMQDEDKIISIVDSFLKDTEISSIKTGVFYLGHKEQFILLDGSRKLYLHINNSKLLKIIIKMVREKYSNDRYKYFVNNSFANSYQINLSNRESSYSTKRISCDDCSECMEDLVCSTNVEFKLMYLGENIASFDRKFIERFIYEKLWEYGKVAYIIEDIRDIRIANGDKVGKCINSYNIICGDLIIKFNCTEFSRKCVFDLCNNIVNRYNSELLEVNSYNKKQLKMEGF